MARFASSSALVDRKTDAERLSMRYIFANSCIFLLRLLAMPIALGEKCLFAGLGNRCGFCIVVERMQESAILWLGRHEGRRFVTELAFCLAERKAASECGHGAAGAILPCRTRLPCRLPKGARILRGALRGGGMKRRIVGNADERGWR